MIFFGPARKFDTIMIFLGIEIENTDVFMRFIKDTFSSKIAICDIFGCKTLIELIFLGGLKKFLNRPHRMSMC